MFFSFDGIDGSGKTTQIKLFAEWLRSQKHDVLVLRDPGGTELGEMVRDILLSTTETPISTRAEMMLYMTSRTQLVDQKIRPALTDGKTVVTDRYVLATLAYQGHAGELSIDEIQSVAQVATHGVEPDLIFLLDVEPAAVAGRRDRKLDRMEQRGLEYLRRVRVGFLNEAELNSDKIHVIDGHQSVDQVQAEIRNAAKTILE